MSKTAAKVIVSVQGLPRLNRIDYRIETGSNLTTSCTYQTHSVDGVSFGELYDLVGILDSFLVLMWPQK